MASKWDGEISACQKMRKRNKSNVYWGNIKLCIGSIKYEDIDTSCPLRYRNILSSTFELEFYANWFKYFDLKIRQFLCLKYFNTLRTKYDPGDKIFQYPDIAYY